MTERVFGAKQPDLWFESGSTGKRKAAPVPLDVLPLLVTFMDVNDPRSVKQVDPTNLASRFGEGYVLREVTLEITRERVTTDVVEGVFDYYWWSVEKRKAYTCKVWGCGKNPLRIHFFNGTSDALTKLDFVRGVKQ